MLAVRVVLLAAALGSVIAALALTRAPDPASPGASAAAAPVRYTCPMHAEVVTPAPGDCPICRMALQPAQARVADTVSVPAGAPSSVAAADVRLALRGPVLHAMTAHAWLDGGGEGNGEGVALFARDEAALVAAGEVGTFRTSAAPGMAHQIRITSAGGEGVRFCLLAPIAGGGGVVGAVHLDARVAPALVIPASAVLESADGPYVMIASEDRRTFHKRPIDVDRVAGTLALVGSGLDETDRVVFARPFLLEAERRAAR